MKYVWWLVGVVVVIGGLVAVVVWQPSTKPTPLPDDNVTRTSDEQPTATDITPTLVSGRYQAYDAALVDDAGFNTTILFFYAGWCPECRAYDQAIQAGQLPDGVQILKVTYDDAQDLRQKYGVTIQSSFVRVNSSADKQVLWNGYGKDKSVEAIIENTR